MNDTEYDPSKKFAQEVDGVITPQCAKCKHYRPEEIACAAFPDGVPMPILVNNVNHKYPVEGDHGIRFEPK